MASPLNREGSVDQTQAHPQGYFEVREEFRKRDLEFVLERLPPETHVEHAQHDPVTGRFEIHHYEKETVSVKKGEMHMPGASLTVEKVVSGRISPHGRRVEFDERSLTTSVLGSVSGRVKEVRADADGTIEVRAEVTVARVYTQEMRETFHPDQPKRVGVSGLSWDIEPRSINPDYGQRAQAAPREESAQQTHAPTAENTSGGSASGGGGGWFSSLWR